jgi:hypothetical protein
MGHVVLLGDSIFDNARYVPGGPPVVEQVRLALPVGWHATLEALDGDVTGGVAAQLRQVPADATQLFVSVGGNDALRESDIINRPARNVGEALELLQEVRSRFRRAYRMMLDGLLRVNRPAAVCTVYDAIPGLGPAHLAALAVFNEVILHEAVRSGVPVIDLRHVCDRREDYSTVSPIEPSVAGGAKIARAIAEVATRHDFGRGVSAVYK